ncbi:TonB-dependent receptor plug domain-containing protein [Parashewanella tropica]|uniref:TonB-dependent receptor plug domain-containing protein n=1 Tax=Parashewanella tropica TaxID=2547970 RepID=UPI00105A1FB1|nr:TonB-dependent receptor [Parashewanella tropica]
MKFSPLYSAMLAVSFISTPTLIEAAENDGVDQEIESIQVQGVRRKLDLAGRLKDVIQQTEVLDAMMIENKNALNLTAAINNEPGVNVSNECSMCGVKRIMLNGMKGEHTTILVDGLPTHTLISGFYGVDAIATTGVDRIEVARGAGASLIAPEAIGGTVNIITKQAYDNQVAVDVAKGSHDFTAIKTMATGVSEDGTTGLTLVGQYDKQDQEDHDNNGVSEAPFIENQSITALISQDVSDSSNIQVRISKIQSEIFGGPVIGKNVKSIGAAIASYDKKDSEHLFEDDDVRKKYIGKPWETTEWIKTTRDEAYIKYLSELSDETVAEFAVSYAKHKQDSFYEGIDYQANDKMTYARAKFDTDFSDEFSLTYGLDIRHEKMRSSTDALSKLPTYQSDSFDYETKGLFLQSTWTPMDEFEIATAVRVDRVMADFVDPKKVGVEIEETFIAPRLDMRYFHNDEFTSRFSAGRGYRAPLSFFETDHGILDSKKGYQIDVDSLEESLSVSYSLAYDADELAITTSIAHSEVENLASLEETDKGVPLLTQLKDTASVSTFDITAGYTINDNWTVNASVEKFIYDKNFRSSYSIAPVEERASFEIQYEKENLKVFWSTVWFGSKDLAKYGYEGFDKKGDKSTKKTLNAPAFSTSDIKAQYQLTESTKIYAGVSNIFEETQIKRGDSPLFFDANGDFDVAYIYGSLHGREIYAGVEVKL